MHDYVSKVSDSNLALTSCSTIATSEPHSYSEVAKVPAWITIMEAEIKALEGNNTWEIVQLPAGEKTIASKWVYKVKYAPKSEVDR